jgi:hypothetical protein
MKQRIYLTRVAVPDWRGKNCSPPNLDEHAASFSSKIIE